MNAKLKLGTVFLAAASILGGCVYEVKSSLAHFMSKLPDCPAPMVLDTKTTIKMENILRGTLASLDQNGTGYISDGTNGETASYHSLGAMQDKGVKICFATQADPLVYDFNTATLNVSDALPEKGAAARLGIFIKSRSPSFWGLKTAVSAQPQPQ